MLYTHTYINFSMFLKFLKNGSKYVVFVVSAKFKVKSLLFASIISVTVSL